MGFSGNAVLCRFHGFFRSKVAIFSTGTLALIIPELGRVSNFESAGWVFESPRARSHLFQKGNCPIVLNFDTQLVEDSNPLRQAMFNFPSTHLLI